MIEEVCYYVEVPVTPRDYARFGADVFLTRGFRVRFLDVSRVINPGYASRYQPDELYRGPDATVAKTEGDVLRFLEAHARSLGVVVFILEEKSLFFYRALRKYRVPYLQFYSGNIPATPVSGKLMKSWREGIRFKSVWYRLSSKIFRSLPGSWMGLQPPRYILKAGRQYTPNCPKPDGRTEVVWAHSLDYDQYLQKIRGEAALPKPSCAVFLDEYLPFHPDMFAQYGRAPYIEPKKYFGALNRFFDGVEDRLGVPVVVAAHPRSRYDLKPECFPGRRVERGRSLDLVAEAECVFTHCSTSVGFAVLYGKPIVFLTSDEIEGDRFADHIRAFSTRLGKRPLNIDRGFPPDLAGELGVDEERYREYREDFLKTSGTPEKPSWEIVADRISSSSGGPA